jgi:exonuclease SbcD
MKEIYLADIHIGQLSDSFVEENGQERSVNETIRQLYNILNYAIENKIKKINIAGDIFENQNPAAKYYELFNKWVKKVNKAGIQLIIVAGNHDQNNSGSSAIAPLRESNYPNIKVFDKGVDVYFDPNTCINYIIIPHLTKSQLGLENVKDYEKQSQKVLLKEIKKRVDKVSKNVIITHIHAAGAMIGAEQRKMKGGINFLPNLKNLGVDIIFSGHLHSHQKVKIGGVDLWYPGSIVRNDFAETKEDKGFLVFDTESFLVEFVKLDTTEYKEFKINLTKKGFISLNEEKVKKSVEEKVVKISIDVDEDNKKGMNLEDIISVFSKYCYVARTEINTIKNEKESQEIKSYNPLEIFKDYTEENVEDKKQRTFVKNEGVKILEEVM